MMRSKLMPCLLAAASLSALACQSRTEEAANPSPAATTSPVQTTGEAKGSIEDAAVGHQLAADGSIAADQKGKDFTPGQTVYVAFRVAKAPPGAIIQANWYGPQDQPVGSDQKTVANGQSNMNFAAKDTSGWGKGDYRVDLVVANEKVDTEHFSIVEPGKEDKTATKPKNAISDAAIGHQLAAGGGIAADQEGKKFAPGGKVYIAFKVGDAPAGTPVHIDWYGPDGQKVGSEDKTVDRKQSYMSFATPDTSGWGKGDYKAELLVKGEKVDTKRFSIVDPAKADKKK